MAKTKQATATQSIKQRGRINRAARQEALRDELKAKEYLRQIGNDYNELTRMAKSIVTVKDTKAKPFNVKTALAKADVRHKILKTKLDTNFRRLNKVLPDLKSVELTDPDGENPFAKFIDLMTEATKAGAK